MKWFGIQIMFVIAALLLVSGCAKDDFGDTESSPRAGTVPGERSSSDPSVEPAGGMGAGAKVGW